MNKEIFIHCICNASLNNLKQNVEYSDDGSETFLSFSKVTVFSVILTRCILNALVLNGIASHYGVLVFISSSST